MVKYLFTLLIILFSGCAYFNTFYNAQNYYRQGKKLITNDTLKIDSEFFDKTIEKATSVIVKYPKSRYVDDALFMMGASYYYKGDYARALEKLDFLAVNYPESKFYDDLLYYKGLAYYKQKKYSDAIIVLKEALQSKDYHTKALIILSYIYFEEKNYPALTKTTEELLKMRLSAQDKRGLLRLMADAQFNQKLYADALQSYNKLLTLTRLPEEHKKLKLKIAEIYLQMGTFEKCKEFLEGEQEPEFRSILADLYVELDSIKQAKALYLEAAISTPDPVFSAQVFSKLAQLYNNEDSLDLAIAYYDSAVNRSMGSGIVGRDSKKMAKILRRVKSLTEEAEHTDRSHFLLAELYLVDLQAPERAVEEYKKVYLNYAHSKWAAKALYAHFWIAHNVFKDDRLAEELALQLTKKYPGSTYARSVEPLFTKKKDKGLEEKR